MIGDAEIIGRIQSRYGTASELKLRNEILLGGELCVESFRKLKVGDGVHSYNELPYLRNLDGTNYIQLAAAGTPEENGIELQLAYEQAKKMPRFLGTIDPNVSYEFYAGQAFDLSDTSQDTYLVTESFIGSKADNEDKVILVENGSYNTEEGVWGSRTLTTSILMPPGEYRVDEFHATESGINLISLSGSPDVYIRWESDNYTDGLISFNGSYSSYVGITTRMRPFILSFDKEIDKSTSYINCSGGDNSFNSNGYEIKGLFMKCKGGSTSFGYMSEISGTFVNCNGTDGSFGSDSNGVASGTFINCIGGGGAFGYRGVASGTFVNCEGGLNSLGYNGVASGTFTNCIGGLNSFGGFGEASGIFEYCTGDLSYSFGGHGVASGKFNYCTGGFGNDGTASGEFNYCRATSGFGCSGIASGEFNHCVATSSFCGDGEATGKFNYCKGGDYSFGGSSYSNSITIVSGEFNSCIGGSYSFGGDWSGSQISGKFTSCIGGPYSFGRGLGVITSAARLYYCRLTAGTFKTPEAGARLMQCIDGTNTLINV